MRARNQILHGLGRAFGQRVEQPLHLLPAEEVGQMTLEHLGQVRGDDRGRVHNRIAGQHGFLALRLADPYGRQVERGFARFDAFHLMHRIARIHSQIVIDEDFRRGRLVALDQQHILAGFQLQVVAQVQRGNDHPHVQGELPADGADAREQVAVLFLVHQGDKPVADFQFEGVEGQERLHFLRRVRAFAVPRRAGFRRLGLFRGLVVPDDPGEEKEHGGKVVWVMGPAFAFDADARAAMAALFDNGYGQALLAGNALATHDLEGALLHTALGQDIYTQKSQPNGHYNHLDVCNKVRRSGSIPQFVKDYDLDDGIICSCVRNNVPIVLAGSIRDDGPLPEVIGDVYEAANVMREQIRGATTVICLATMLHTIATGNMTPSFRVLEDGTVRPVYLYTVDADEFVVNKLLDRGSLSATTIVTNVQDFITLVAKGLGVIK